MTNFTSKKIKFVKIPVDTIGYVISLKGMTSFKYQLWLYLYSLDPFGDRFISIPSPTELADKFGVDYRTVKRAIDFFCERGLIDYQIEKWKIRNIIHKIPNDNSDPSDNNFDPKKCISDPSDDNFDPPKDISDPNCLSKPAPCNNSGSPQTIQTIQTLSYSSDPHPPTPKKQEREEGENAKGENAGADGKEVSRDVTPLVNPTKENSVCEAEILQEKKDFSARNTQVVRKTTDGSFGKPKPTRQEIVNPYPEGEWMNGKQLDPDFVEWLARTWLISDEQKFLNIHNAKKCVRLHFIKTPCALPIEWQQYHEETKHRYENAQTRITHGLNIPSDEQAMLASRAKAVVTPIEELSNATPVNVVALPSSQPTQNVPSENASAYQLWKPSNSESDPSPEEATNIFAALSQQMRAIRGGSFEIKSMPEKNDVREQKDPLQELNEWMQDPILREEAIARVKASDRYTFEYGDYGTPIGVIEPEF